MAISTEGTPKPHTNLREQWRAFAKELLSAIGQEENRLHREEVLKAIEAAAVAEQREGTDRDDA